MSKILRGGTLVTASETVDAEILIEGEKISAIGRNFTAGSDDEIIDCTGKLIMPGGIDVHTHFDLPMFGTHSSDDHYTGHKAAAFGGTTTALDFISQDLPDLPGCVKAWHEKADSKAAIDYGFHMNITHFDEKIAREIPGLVEQGITSIKVFSAYNNRLRLQDGEIFQVMRIAKKHGLLTMLHAENGDVIDLLIAEALEAGHLTPEWHALTRPAWGAVEAVLRGEALSAQAGGAPLYIVHMNVGGEADQLAYARSKGLPVMGETCPQYLFFTIDDLRRPDGAKWVCSPPVREKTDNNRLWGAILDGTIQVLATDHCPFYFNGTKPITYEGKEIAIPGKELGRDDFTKIPNGLPGVGDRLPVFWTSAVESGKITPNQFVSLTSTNPARIFGMYPQKGTIMPGSDADLVVWDPKKRVKYGVKYSHHRTDYNLYEGFELKGFPERVYSRGRLIVDGEKWLGRAGEGRFLHRIPYAPVL
jgi:dihydropyrimidinase